MQLIVKATGYCADCRAGCAQPRGATVADHREVGPATAAAMVATIGNPQEFRNGRQFAAWVGLTPKQHSTGFHKTLVTIANKHARIIWALLVKGETFDVKRWTVTAAAV